MADKIWFITGASTGLGRELAEQLLAEGVSVVATARKPEQLALLSERFGKQVLVLALDVTDAAAVDQVVNAAIEQFGRIDVLVNNAGYGIAGAIEEATEDEFMPVFETNVFGLIRTTRAVLPHMRRERSGHILNLSSIAGLVASPGWGYYNATKFAVEGFSDALAQEVAPLGIHVTTVEPGPFRTDFLGRSAVEMAARIDDYDATAGKTRIYMRDQAGKQAGDPAKAVAAMIAAVAAADPPRHLVLGRFAFDRMQARLTQWAAELEASKATSLGADYEAGR